MFKLDGRINVSDVVAEDHLTTADRQHMTLSGRHRRPLSKREYLDGLAAAGFVDTEVRFTHEAEPQLHAAVIQAAPSWRGRADRWWPSVAVTALGGPTVSEVAGPTFRHAGRL